jgi:hypothetical protein
LVFLNARRDRCRTYPTVKQLRAGAARVPQDHHGGQEPDGSLRDGEYRDSERGLDEHQFVLLVDLTPRQALALKCTSPRASMIWTWID